MSASARFSLLSTLLLTPGCSAIVWGNLGVLGVTVGIFLGTVFLSRGSNGDKGASCSSSSTTTRS